MKTVIDEIIEASNFLNIIDFKRWFNEENGRLKEKEKQQIIEAYEKDMSSNGNLSYESGLEYYNETFS